eukprot:1579993-Prorocentrum_lima.AAC.1
MWDTRFQTPRSTARAGTDGYETPGAQETPRSLGEWQASRAQQAGTMQEAPGWTASHRARRYTVGEPV